MWSKKQNFCLDVHFTPMEMSPYIKSHDRYTYDELENIFDETDILVVPSIWYETFGFTVLEALSYGVPVIISGTVGSKDILVVGAGIVVEDMDASKLAMTIQDITVDKLRKMNRIIAEKQIIMQIEDMSNQIEQNCYRLEK